MVNAEHGTTTGLAPVPGCEWSSLVSSSRACLERLNIWVVEIINETAKVSHEGGSTVPAALPCGLHDAVGT